MQINCLTTILFICIQTYKRMHVALGKHQAYLQPFTQTNSLKDILIQAAYVNMVQTEYAVIFIQQRLQCAESTYAFVLDLNEQIDIFKKHLHLKIQNNQKYRQEGRYIYIYIYKLPISYLTGILRKQYGQALLKHGYVVSHLMLLSTS